MGETARKIAEMEKERRYENPGKTLWTDLPHALQC
jgi:hypothetical protein